MFQLKDIMEQISYFQDKKEKREGSLIFMNFECVRNTSVSDPVSDPFLFQDLYE